MSAPLTNDDRAEQPTCVLRWWKDPISPERRLQQKWIIHRVKAGGAQFTYEEWRDVPEEQFYG